MKKLFILSLIFGSLALFVPETNAATTAAPNVAEPQVRVQIGQRSRRGVWRPQRARTYTRIVTIGRNRYRETVRVSYFYGRQRTQVIRRVRIGRAW